MPQLHEELLYASTDSALFGIFLGVLTLSLEGSSIFEIDFDYFLVELLGFVLISKIFYFLVLKRILLFLRSNFYFFQIILFISIYFFLFFYLFLEFFVSFNFNLLFDDMVEEEFFSIVRNEVMGNLVLDFWEDICKNRYVFFLTADVIENIDFFFFFFFFLNLADFVTMFLRFVEFITEELLGRFQRYDAGTISASMMDTQYFY